MANNKIRAVENFFEDQKEKSLVESTITNKSAEQLIKEDQEREDLKKNIK